MGLEVGNTIADLNANWPLGSDPKAQGDDHLRLIKAVLLNDVWSKAANPKGFVSKDGDTMTGALTIDRSDGSVQLGILNSGSSQFTRATYPDVKINQSAIGLWVDGSAATVGGSIFRVTGSAVTAMFDVLDSGVVRAGHAEGGAGDTAGGVVLELDSFEPGIKFTDRSGGDNTDNRILANGGGILKITDNGGNLIYSFNGGTSGEGIPTRDYADNRYARLATSNVFSGFIRVPDGTLGTPSLQFGNNNIGIFVNPGSDFNFKMAGDNIGRLDHSDTSVPADNYILKRGAGDARYFQLSTAWNGVGSTVLARNTSATQSPGDTISGGSLSPCNANGNPAPSGSMAGSWLCCGYSQAQTDARSATDFRRLS
ncbi:hypothetical protein [Qingshengfaniella alkalisoli]|uniref:Uncharacterized protein n=1 Tax=Qingshengfaniella alkalisoli TaxID=2599296 RepID=A0A5B8I8K9_9RHOB|nr:hypothetical protein [Qingshengfaniella alkalisoli]QDY70129.1 hypothetical protein FPZ52_11185 [Qingshengfaniella alkalisoli]